MPPLPRPRLRAVCVHALVGRRRWLQHVQQDGLYEVQVVRRWRHGRAHHGQHARPCVAAAAAASATSGQLGPLSTLAGTPGIIRSPVVPVVPYASRPAAARPP